GRDVNELAGDPQARPRLPHTAFEHVAHPEFTADLLDVDCLPFVGEGRVPSDDEQPPEPREGGDDVVNQPVSEILLLWIAAQIAEGENCDGWLLRQLER